MKFRAIRSIIGCIILTMVLCNGVAGQQTVKKPEWLAGAANKLEAELTAKHGDTQKARLQRGLKQVTALWRESDGDQAVFEEFVRTHFAGDQATLDTMFERFEYNLEQIYGHSGEIGRELRQQADLDRGPVMPFDEIFGAYDVTAHLTDDLFNNKIAFVVLLNFPLTTLDERLANGERWTRRQWAETRLAQNFARRIPADVNLAIARSDAAADNYIANYNIWMHLVVDSQGRRLFPAGMRLLTHWNLRDQIKADYSDKENGLAKQRTIQRVMERIVTQTIPNSVARGANVDWEPVSNAVKPSAVKDGEPGYTPGSLPIDAPEPNLRYERWLSNFRAVRLADPYSPLSPTFIERSFNDGRELTEARVRQMFEQGLSSPQIPRVAALIEKRLGRPIEPFDIWYAGFRPRAAYTEEQLDKIVAERYPTAEAYQQDIPRMLRELGFSDERARYLADNIVVDPARGSGHALGASMRKAKAHLRTRVGKNGMDYKGYNIAVHEMGHNVEQTFSLNNIDHYSLQGVPNTAFTEALAFVFQERDLELLGLVKPNPESEALNTLDDLWGAYEIAGVALVDMAVWHWMYDHPNATAEELKQATLEIARGVWNKYYAPVFKTRDVVLLGIYSHMINNRLYLPDYPIGHLIAYQIKEQMHKAGKIGPEFERMTLTGNISPDLWMKKATGAPVGSQALLAATEQALKDLEKR